MEDRPGIGRRAGVVLAAVSGKGDTGDDRARVERQSVVLNAIFTKLQSASATELIGSMRKLVPYVTTSLSLD